jgi:NAD dependent epimerase/dehydratase
VDPIHFWLFFKKTNKLAPNGCPKSNWKKSPRNWSRWIYWLPSCRGSRSWGWLEHVSKEVRSELEVFQGDIRDPFRVKESMQSCDLVFHLAALIAIPYSYHAPSNYVDTNILGTLNVLQAARELSISKVVHTSTSEVYGTARFVPISEDHPFRGQSPYAATKIGADQIALSYYRSFGTPIAIIRPFNTYGPRQSARAIIPTIITQVAQGKGLIRLGKLSPTRDFSFVKDTVRGFIAVAATPSSVGEEINISSGFEVSIGKTAQLIALLMGQKIEILSDETRFRPEKSEVERLWGDNRKAEVLLGWKPHYTEEQGLRAGLCETIQWFTESSNLGMYKSDIYNL